MNRDNTQRNMDAPKEIKSKLGDKKGALADFTKAKELSLELDIPDLQSDL